MATYIVDRQVEAYYGSEQMKRMDQDRAKAESERNGGRSGMKVGRIRTQ